MFAKYRFFANYKGNKEKDLFFVVCNPKNNLSIIFESGNDKKKLLKKSQICEGCLDENCDCREFVTSPRGIVRRYEVLSRKQILE